MEKVLIIDDDELMCETMLDLVEEMGCSASYVGTLTEGVRRSREESWDVVVLDVLLPDGNGLDALPALCETPSRPEVVIITGQSDAEGAELAIKNGAWDYISKASSLDAMRLPILRALQYRREKQAKDGEGQRAALLDVGLVGKSQPMRQCLSMVARAARGDVSVLVHGETGTGKELLAKAIHENSQRAEQPLVIVDCATLSEQLVESELFGHVKGAFTGAERESAGLVLQANGGTLFLDEIGELPLNMQRAFLRVLQEKRVRPVGSQKEVPCDFRLVAATNRDLPAMAEEGTFREDLLYRINAVTIHVPPLRERKGDVAVLARHFVRRFGERHGQTEKDFAPECLEALEQYHWPGNVRELKNTLESVLTFAMDASTLYRQHLPEHIRIRDIRNETAPRPEDHYAFLDQLEDILLPTWKEYRENALLRAEEEYFQNLLAFTNGDTAKAMALSGLSKAQFYKLLKRAMEE